jgi:hypothetical protein
MKVLLLIDAENIRLGAGIAISDVEKSAPLKHGYLEMLDWIESKFGEKPFLSFVFCPTGLVFRFQEMWRDLGIFVVSCMQEDGRDSSDRHISDMGIKLVESARPDIIVIASADRDFGMNPDGKIDPNSLVIIAKKNFAKVAFVIPGYNSIRASYRELADIDEEGRELIHIFSLE